MDEPAGAAATRRSLLLPILRAAGLRCPAVFTVGRLLADAGGLRAVPPRPDNRGRHKRPRPPHRANPRAWRGTPKRSWQWAP